VSKTSGADMNAQDRTLREATADFFGTAIEFAEHRWICRTKDRLKFTVITLK
jgi:hypothetical protein